MAQSFRNVTGARGRGLSRYGLPARDDAQLPPQLGWSHGDDEIIPTRKAIAWFNLESIGRSPARLDFKKLDNLNAHYIRATDEHGPRHEIENALAREAPPRALSEKGQSKIAGGHARIEERAKTLVELTQSAEFLF